MKASIQMVKALHKIRLQSPKTARGRGAEKLKGLTVKKAVGV